MSADPDVSPVAVETSDVVARLRRLGEERVPSPTAAAHVGAMSQGGPSRRLRRAVLVGATAAGFLLGTTGLAAAGVLPGRAQGAAHRTLHHVGIEVPEKEQKPVVEEEPPPRTATTRPGPPPERPAPPPPRPAPKPPRPHPSHDRPAPPRPPTDGRPR